MKIVEQAILDVTNFRRNCKRAAKQMGWDLKDTSYAVWDFTLSALEKQIPKEPIRKERTLEGGAITYWHICPTCKNRGLLDRWHRELKHCPHCGQALKWGDAHEG